MKVKRTIKEKLMDKIGFLNWVELSPESIQVITDEPGKDYWKNGGQVFISPDVNSLHIIWTRPKDQAAEHLIANYPYDEEDLSEWLSTEIFFSSDYKYNLSGETIYERISDFKEWNENNVPIMTIEELN